MLSRVANCIFWLNRYIERAESVARFIDVNLNMTLDLGEDVQEQWQPLVFTTGDQELFAKLYGTASEQNVIAFLTFDERNPNSILSCVKFARENARTVRETISSPMWEEVNKFYLAVREAKAFSQSWSSSYDFFNRVKLFSQEFAGICDATMTHDEAWHFSRVGRLLERADKTSRILDVKYYLLLPSTSDVGTPLDIIEWGALLKSASALEMYRQRHGRITPTLVAQFLILDREFPRAMHFCLIKSQESLRAILGDDEAAAAASVPFQLMEKLRLELDAARIETIIAHGLHEFIDGFQTRLNAIGTAITQAFFSTESPVEECPGEESAKALQE
jgi:uncharacterized alpha-E superfamily protein